MNMKSIAIAAALFFVALSQAHAQSVTPEMEAAFLGKLKLAVAQKDYAQFSALHCNDGALDSEMAGLIEKSNQGAFQQLIAISSPKYSFSAPPATQVTSFTRNGKGYVANLTVVEILNLSSADASPNTAAAGTWGLPLGVKDGALMIVTPEEKTP